MDLAVHSEARPTTREPDLSQSIPIFGSLRQGRACDMARITKIQPRPNSFRVDNIIIDEYGEKIGAIGVAIYNVLARHADRETGICYPGIRLIARKLALGRTTVKKYLRILLNHCLIAISPRLSDEGDPTSNLYMLLDPSPEKVALRRRQLEALLRPQEGAFKLDPASDRHDGGRSLDDPPPCLLATDPQSPADPEQIFSLNKNNGTSFAALLPTEKQKTCAHPPSEIVFLSDATTIICHHCYGLLDENLKLRKTEETVPADIVAA
jgi:GntR family transcriptional regulator